MFRKSCRIFSISIVLCSVSSAPGSLFLGSAPGNDAASVNSVLGMPGMFDQDDHVTNIDGDHTDEFGPLLSYFTVHDADPADPDSDGNAFDSDDQVVQWWLEGVPADQAPAEPFYISIKVGGRDNFIYQWDTGSGDTFQNPGTGGAGFVDFHSMVYDLRTSPVNGSSIQQGISHVAIVAKPIPEPASAVLWLLSAALIGLHRMRK